MLHALMSLLCQYVEKECDGLESFQEWTDELLTLVSPENSEGEHALLRRQGLKQAEVLAIYRWWKEQRPKELAKIDELMDVLYSPDVKHGQMQREAMFEELTALEGKRDQDEEGMLIRLMKIRTSLWT